MPTKSLVKGAEKPRVKTPEKKSTEKPESQLPPWMNMTVDEAAYCARLVRVIRAPKTPVACLLTLLLDKDAAFDADLTVAEIKTIVSEFENFQNWITYSAEHFRDKAPSFKNHPALDWLRKPDKQPSWSRYGLDRLLANTRKAEELAGAGGGQQQEDK